MEISESDQELIKRCLKKDRKAQFELYEKYKIRLFGLCRRYARSDAEAHDFLQEGFIKIFRSLHQYRADGPFVKWMERVMVNRTISLLRKKKLKLDDNFDLHSIRIAQNTNISASEKAETVIKLIRQLSPGYQTVFNLYALEGYSHKEIAQTLGISESTSRSQYTRAKKAVKAAFEQLKSVDS